jgi:undecaprenyl-phosphate 4-deoxy-4-formamido-L-arabinose transferase
MKGTEMKISIVIPVYNAEKTIKRLVNELMKELQPQYPGVEIVLINDGSRDRSHEECLAVFERHKDAVKYIALAKNFGEHNAVMAGLNYATGDYAVIIDDDFQNPPQEISKLTNKSEREGFDVVYSFYDKKSHPWHRNLGSGFNNFVASCLLRKPRGLYLSSFKCLNRFTIDEVVKYKGPYPYIDGLILRATQNIGKALVRHEKRAEGKSGYTFAKLIKLWLNMFVNFSVYPLRVSMFFGFLFSIVGGIGAIWMIIEKMLNPDIPRGITLILVAVLVLSGLQLIMLGVMGEYIGKQFLSTNQTPQFVIRQMLLNDRRGIGA